MFPQDLRRTWRTLNLDERTWRTLDLDESEGPPRQQQRDPRPVGSRDERNENHKRQWCQLDISDDVPVGPRSGGPRKTGQRGWSQLDLQETGEDEHPVRRHDWRQLELYDHAVPAPPVAQIKQASLSATTLSFLSNLPTKKVLNAYDKNGMDPGRIRHVLMGTCKCSPECGDKFTFKDIHHLCCVYHQMLEGDRQYMLHTMYTSEAASQVSVPEVQGPRTRHN